MAYAELNIDQGASFTTTLDLAADDGTPVNLTGCTFIAQIRKSYYSASVTETFSINVSNPISGNLAISLASANTANIRPGRYLYDIKMTDTNQKVIRLVEGIVTIMPQVSRE